MLQVRSDPGADPGQAGLSVRCSPLHDPSALPSVLPHKVQV
jgi:hypothetical protein